MNGECYHFFWKILLISGLGRADIRSENRHRKSRWSVTFIKIFSMTRVDRKTSIFFSRKKLWQIGYTVTHVTDSQGMAVSSTSQDVDISSV